MIDKVLKMSKSVDDEKVGVSFQMPKNLKEKIDNLCADNGIKLTTFFNSLAQVAIDEHYTHEINRDEIHSEILSLRQWIDSWSGGDEDEQIEYHNNLAKLAELNKLLIVG